MNSEDFRCSTWIRLIQLLANVVRFWEIDNVMISTRQIKKHNKQTALFGDIMIWPSMMFPYCQSNPKGLIFGAPFWNHTHENYTYFQAQPLMGWVSRWNFMTCSRIRPGPGAEPGGLVQREIGWWKLWACWPCGKWQVPILSPRYHGSLVWNHSLISELARYDFFRYHCMLICWFSQPKVLQDDFSNK